MPMLRERLRERLPGRTVLLAAAMACVLAAQQDQQAVFRSETRLVVCNTTVVDTKTGHLVTDLPKTAFTVFENDVKQEIKIFKREDVPVSMGLLVDNSGSMRMKRSSVESAALDLVKDSNPDDEVFIVNFNDVPYIDNPHGQSFISNIDEMKEALSRLDARGGTAMRDAVQESIDWMKKANKDKKVLVLITDGVDNSSDEVNNSLEKVVRSARQSGVVIYCVGLLNEEIKRDAARAKRELNALAEASGGETYYPKDVSEVDKIAHQVARDIRNQYTIEYTPSNTAMDGTYRKIRIALTAPGKLVPRTRTGYYATPDQAAPATKPGGGSHLRP
jgi:Ca-activated chloride channel homolog